MTPSEYKKVKQLKRENLRACLESRDQSEKMRERGLIFANFMVIASLSP